MKNILLFWMLTLGVASGCKKNDPTPTPTPTPDPFSVSIKVNGSTQASGTYANVGLMPTVEIISTKAINTQTIATGISFVNNQNGSSVVYSTIPSNGDKTITIKPASNLQAFSTYKIAVNSALKATDGGMVSQTATAIFHTGVDTTDKFPRISEAALLDKVQATTLKYFYDFGHPTSGMARERNNSGETVTTGGTGFGIMAMIAGASRNFITRQQALTRITTIANFLNNNAQKFHGAFPHWMNGTTGEAIAFSANDNGADLIETSFLLQGLICARQYFINADATETTLRNTINTIVNGVEWDWFRKNNEQVLYWHWSPTAGWAMNMKIEGWNEGLVTYVLAASSTTHPIPASVYTQGFARNGAMQNGQTYFGHILPLGEPNGGPLFFAHYSFLGINPNGLSDAYANYQTQVTNHTMINYKYCLSKPENGYSAYAWGLSASDIPGGYTASSPSNDVGVIAPTAALSSMPYTPVESKRAMEFFYYKLGDKLWGEYGFKDAFKINTGWFADSYLAIDQGPIVVMIENYRSGLLWNLFTSAPEVKTGMQSLGFAAPYL